MDFELADEVPAGAIVVRAELLSEPVEVVSVTTLAEIARLEAAAAGVKVTDKPTADAAAILFKQVQTLMQTIETARQTVKAPFLIIERAIDAAAKAPQARLLATKEKLNRGIVAFVTEQERLARALQYAEEKRQREEEARLRREQEAREAAARKLVEETKAKGGEIIEIDLPAEEPLPEAAPIAPAPARVIPAGVQVRRTLVFRIVALNQVPEEYLKPREVAVVRVQDKYCRNWDGKTIPKVAGLEFYAEANTR